MYTARLLQLKAGVMLLFLAGCFASKSASTGPLVINVLDQAAYDDCHIPGSIQVDFDKVVSYVEAKPKDTVIVLYCSNYLCSASHFAAQQLINKGYTYVRVYGGGMADWYGAGLPVEGNAEAPYLHKQMQEPKEALSHVPIITRKELAELLKIV